MKEWENMEYIKFIVVEWKIINLNDTPSVKHASNKNQQMLGCSVPERLENEVYVEIIHKNLSQIKTKIICIYACIYLKYSIVQVTVSVPTLREIQWMAE